MTNNSSRRCTTRSRRLRPRNHPRCVDRRADGTPRERIGLRSHRQRLRDLRKLSSFWTRKTEKLRYDKINTDPYAHAKRTARCLAAIPALQSDPVGPAPCTPQAHACRLLGYPYLAVARAHGAKATRRFRRVHSGSPQAPQFLTSPASRNCSTL